MRIGGFGDGWTPKTSIFPQISPKSLQNIARKWAFLVNALKKCFFHPNLPQFPPIFAQNLRILDGENVEFWRFPPKKKKMIFFYHIKKWYFRPISTHFCPISPPLERICQKKWSFASGFRGPKIGLFSPHFLPLFTAEAPKRGKKGSENFGWETPKKPHSHRRAPGGHFFGVKKGLFGGPILRSISGPKNAVGKWRFWGVLPQFWGSRVKKNGRFEKTAPKWGGNLGEFGENWGKLGGKWGKSGGKRRKWLKMGETTQKWGKLGQKVAELGEVD